MPSSRGSSQPKTKLRSPALQVDSLPSEPPGKPKNIGVGSLSVLQVIFPTQESNWGLLHCRQILYQLSHQGSLAKGCLSINDHLSKAWGRCRSELGSSIGKIQRGDLLYILSASEQ